jgi:histidinol-phosphatase (PHP family)
MNNFHTHTWRCKHATGTVKDYVKAAVEKKMKILGMSDHTPLPDNRWPHVRMDMSDLDAYEQEFIDAETEDIILLRGLECEWDPEYRNFYRDELLGERNFDFLIGSLHFIKYGSDWAYLSEIRTAKHLANYAELLIKTMRTGLFSFIAHPDGFGAGYRQWDKNTEACAIDILTAAEELSIPLEINGFGLRKNKITTVNGDRSVYPLLNFWELAGSFNIKTICNSDAHNPKDVDASIEDCMLIANQFNLNIIDDIRI